MTMRCSNCHIAGVNRREKGMFVVGRLRFLRMIRSVRNRCRIERVRRIAVDQMLHEAEY
jgi:hypothetical protein